MHHRNGTSVWTGLAAGAAGGLAASYAMGLAYQWINRAAGGAPRSGVQADNTEIAEQLAGRHLSTAQKYTAGSALHYAIGTVVGGLYGAAASAAPAVSKAAGVPFGAAVWAGLHLAAAPAMGLSHPYEAPLVSEAAELASHLVYGLTTELVRRALT